MNKAESARIASYLEALGWKQTLSPQVADVVVLNTCVVRQNAEDKVLGMLGYAKGLKNRKPQLALLVTGCFVGPDIAKLEKLFPYVDRFFGPGDLLALVDWADKCYHLTSKSGTAVDVLPARKGSVSAFVPIIQGCDNFCSYCIVPYRRGREKSRPAMEIIHEAKRLALQGIKEIILLGQNVNSYGHDLSEGADLARLLCELDRIEGIKRIRFMTNHPKDMSEQLIRAVASLEKVCEHISLPLQSGDNDILKAMRRGYTVEQYRELVSTIRYYIPAVAISTDVIVGFPGEGEEHFDHTLLMLEEIKFDTVHVAAYSPRPDTVAARELVDNVPASVKQERVNKIETLQMRIAGEINARLKGESVEVLVEGRKGDKWFGRTRTNKLTFFRYGDNCLGQLVHVTITKTSPWALQGDQAC